MQSYKGSNVFTLTSLLRTDKNVYSLYVDSCFTGIRWYGASATILVNCSYLNYYLISIGEEGAMELTKSYPARDQTFSQWACCQFMRGRDFLSLELIARRGSIPRVKSLHRELNFPLSSKVTQPGEIRTGVIQND